MKHLKRAISLLLAVCATGCGAASIKPAPQLPANLPLKISITPAFPMPGTAMRVVCRIPPDIENGIFVFAVADVFDSQGPIDSIQYERVMTMGCQPITIVCGYKEYKTPHGWQQPVTISQTVNPAGECH
jgi:hypothetical protein